MQPKPPPQDASPEAVLEYLYQDHKCRETQHAEVMDAADQAKMAALLVADEARAAATLVATEAKSARVNIVDNLRADRKVNLIGIATLILAVLGGYAAAINTLRDIQESQHQLANAGKGRDTRLDNLDASVGAINTRIGILCDIAVTNHEALIGPDKSGRNCR